MSGSELLVLVTGASGFVGSHVTRQLLENGFRVRVTVRNVKNEKKVKPLSNLCPSAKFPVEIVEADLLDAESWPKVVEGCTYVIHVASPFPMMNPKTADEVIKPAVDGTVNVLKACAAAQTVKRVVLTSSIVAIGSGGIKESNSFTEEDFVPENAVMFNFYSRSKVLAEAAAWKFVEELPEGQKIELAVINPGFVMGPIIHGATGTSIEILKQLLEREVPMALRFSFMICDVRNVASAHVKCMTLPEAAGKRHIVASEQKWLKEMAEILDREFRSQGYRVPTKEMPRAMEAVVKIFNSQLKMGAKSLGQKLVFDNSRMKDVLQIDPIPVEKTIIDMAYTAIEQGFVKKTAKYRGPNSSTQEAQTNES